MQDQTTLVSVLGSGNLITSLPDRLDDLFIDGVLVNRNPVRHGHPHEMAGYKAYLALKALELRGRDCTLQKQQLLDAILTRLKNSNGFWQHSHLSVGGSNNHGLRSTAAGIKLLAIAYVDGLFKDRELLVNLLKKQLSFHEKLQDGGTWFFHDSAEGTPVNKKKGKILNIGNGFGSSDYNALVLNTHVETLNTLMLVTDLLDLDDKELKDYLQEGTLALKRVLGNDYRQSFKFRLFQQVETAMRRSYLSQFSRKKTIFNKLYNTYFWTYRSNSLQNMPGFQHNDGYLERALYYKSTTYNYHMVNLLDLLRFVKLHEKKHGDLSWKEQISQIIKKALDYAFSPAYFHYIKHYSKQSCTAIQLCEAIVICWARGEYLEEKWVSNYLKVRNILPPSPAILGFDPAIVTSIEQVDEMTASNYLTDKIDLFVLPKKEILLVNHSQEEVPLVLDKRYKKKLLNANKLGAVIPAQAAIRLIPIE